MTKSLSGKTLAEELRREVGDAVKMLKSEGINPTLAVVVATEDESAHYYVQLIDRTAKKLGIEVHIANLDPHATFEKISNEISRLANNKEIDGIILQTPLSDDINADSLRGLIPPEKDIDGANPLSAGRLMSDLEAFGPATPAAVMEILSRHKVPLAGKVALVVGRSRIVGKPVAHMLLAKNATVTICHSHTINLPALTAQADILVVAVGKPRLIGASHIKKGAVVIDVGTTVTENGKLVGDVDAGSVANVAGALTPVPGGVGPVTTALLLKHTIKAAQHRNN